MFHKRDGTWELAGILHTILPYPGQSAAYSVYGNATFFSDLSVYRDEILDTMAAHSNYSIMGDLNLDGVVSGDGTGPIESDDLSAFIAGWRHEHAPVNIEAWKEGDLNLDGVTDLRDFALLREAYSGAGAIAGLLGAGAVPEPSSAMLIALISAGLAGLWFWRNRLAS